MLKYFLILIFLLSACADDGSFDFSRTTTTNNTTFNIENNESSLGQDDDNDSGNGMSGSNPICLDTQEISDGFLSKPISDSNGNLVILFPKKFGERFEKVTIEDGSGLVEEGRFSNFGNGERQHYRFSMPGSDYAPPLKVTAFSSNGECVWIVNDPSQRTE